MQSKTNTLIWANKLILLITVLILAGCGPEANDQQLVQTAKTFLEQNQLREAALELKNALQKNPDNPEARYLLGIINLDAGDAATAEKEFRRAADAGWQEGLSRIGQARALIKSGEFQKVIDEIAVKDEYPATERANLTALRALAQASLGDIDQAMQTLDAAVELDPDALHVLKSSIQIYLARHDNDRASSILNKALVSYKNNPEILLLSAALATINKDFPTAAAAYNNVIEQDSDKLITIYGRQARLGLARLEIFNREIDKAQAILLPLFKQNTEDPETNFVGGLLAFEQGNLNLAEERLLNVLKVAPDHAPTQLLFGTVNYAQQDYEQSAYYIAKYLNVVPNNIAARKLLGQAYIKLGQHNEAQAALQPGLDSSDDDADLLALVSLSQLQGGNLASGIEGLEKAVKSAPENSSLRSELARAYITAGETESAINELNEILTRDGNKRQTDTLLVAAHIKARQYDKAIDVVLDMLQENPNDPSVLSLAGNVFVQSNDRVEARKYFNRALEIKPDYVPAAMLLARLEEIDNHPDKAEALYKRLAEHNTQDSTPLLALARLAEAQNQQDTMLEWLEKARVAAPNDIRAHKVLAEYYLRAKQLDKVAPLISEAQKIAPRDNSLLLLQAKLQLAENQNNKALSTLNELITRSPNSSLARTLLVEAYLKLKQPADARRQLDIVLEKQPYYLPALILMANLELQTDNYVNSLAIAEKIQKIKPDLHLGFELAGDAAMMQKDYPIAKRNYEKAMLHKPSSELAIKLSETSTHSGDFQAATQPLLAWLEDNPSDARALQFLGTAYQNMEQNKKATESYEKALAIQPDNIVALNNLAWLYSLENNPKSLELAERAYTVSPNDPGIQDTYGWILVQQGQTDKGRQILEQAVKTLTNVPEVQYHYAISLMKSGNEQEARKLLKQLLESEASFVGRDEAQQMLK